MKKQFFSTLDYLLLNGEYLKEAHTIFKILLWHNRINCDQDISMDFLLDSVSVVHRYSKEDIEKFRKFLINMPEIQQLNNKNRKNPIITANSMFIPANLDFVLRNIATIEVAMKVYTRFDYAAYKRAVVGHTFLKKSYPFLIAITILLGLLSIFSIVAKVLFILFFIMSCVSLLIFIYIPRPRFFIKREDHE